MQRIPWKQKEGWSLTFLKTGEQMNRSEGRMSEEERDQHADMTFPKHLADGDWQLLFILQERHWPDSLLRSLLLPAWTNHVYFRLSSSSRSILPLAYSLCFILYSVVWRELTFSLENENRIICLCYSQFRLQFSIYWREWEYIVWDAD